MRNWWLREDLKYINGDLQLSGHPLNDLARQFGTPSFVYSSERIKSNILRIHSALHDNGFAGKYNILYAMKANRFAPLLTYIKQLNLTGIDACSPPEVELALGCGFTDKQISFTATSLAARDFDLLANYPNITMVCDSISAIRQWGSRRPGSSIGIRINPGVGISRNNNDKLKYAGEVVTKFGIYKDQYLTALQVAAEYDLKVSKIHFHAGCGYLTEQLDILQNVMDNALWFVKNTPDVRVLNIGGGLGVPHTKEDRALDLNQWASMLCKLLGDLDLTLEVEPGDYIAKDAGVLLLSKTFIEEKKNKMFIGVDAGFNIAPEPAYYKLPFEPVVLRLSDDLYQENNEDIYDVVGNINEALDVWYENAYLPGVKQQEYLALINAGAYSSSMASNHCMRGTFKEFLLF